MHTDPVCRMEIDEDEAEGSTTYEGQTYYFCSADCLDRFERNPDQYVHQHRSGGTS